MIRVAFLLNFSKDYKGGINYIKNLLYTNSITKFPELEFYLFVPTDIEKEYTDIFLPYAKIIYTNIFKKYTLPWLLNKGFNYSISFQLPLYLLFKKYKIDIVSHSFFWGRYRNLKTINWIPDFQCLHYPDLWSKKELKKITNINNNIAKYSDVVILSSYDALKDYKHFAPLYEDKAKVLQFVSQPGVINDVDDVFAVIQKKYSIPDKFFYLPNQFWSHKNHITAFKAINLLIKRGLNPVLVTTGVMTDFRGNNKNMNIINDYIQENNLQKNILLLGLIHYKEVLVLMRKCTALINPSFFEGWSSTVEEAKSLGKRLVISDIPVHREQNPDNAFFFDPKNENDLADFLEIIEKDTSKPVELSNELKVHIEEDLLNRTIAFSENYYKIIKDLVNKSRS